MILIASLATAEPVVTLPLDGYYRPGKFFPVLVGGGKDIEIQVENGISARAATDGHSGRLLPVMLLSPTTRSLRVVIDGQTRQVPVRALEADQKLVIGGGGQLEIPGVRVVRVLGGQVDAAFPWMYESADFIGFPEHTFEMNFPAGPWVHAGLTAVELPAGKSVSLASAKVIPSRRRGPENSVAPAAYAVLDSLLPARAPATRRAVWLILALFAIVVVGVAMSRWKRSVVVVAGLSLVWVAATALYARRAARPVMAEGRIVIPSESDRTYRWIARTSADSMTESFAVPLSTFIRPIFADHAATLSMWVDEGCRFHYSLRPGVKAVFVLEELDHPTTLPPATAVPGEMFRDIARRYYLRAGEKLVTRDSEFVIEKQ